MTATPRACRCRLALRDLRRALVESPLCVREHAVVTGIALVLDREDVSRRVGRQMHAEPVGGLQDFFADDSWRRCTRSTPPGEPTPGPNREDRGCWLNPWRLLGTNR